MGYYQEAMRRLGLVGFLLVCTAGAQSLPANQEIATVETTADATVHGDRFDSTSEVLEASGQNDVILLRFRTGLIEKWTVQKALVAVHTAKGVDTPGRILVSAVREEWSQASVKPPQVERGVPATTRAFKDGWITFELPASIANQLASGQASSIAVSVPEGGRLAFHSRRTIQFTSYLLVRGERAAAARPAVIK